MKEKKKTAASGRIPISLSVYLLAKSGNLGDMTRKGRIKWLTDQQHLARSGLEVPQKGEIGRRIVNGAGAMCIGNCLVEAFYVSTCLNASPQSCDRFATPLVAAL